jgi:AcrR family transcriptional regulator
MTTASNEHVIPTAVVRRAPFSENPRVGARGQRTQQRILDAALRVFSEEGYHRSSIDRIAKVGGCSRVAFYQYFASKDDLFQHLAGQVARQLSASTEALDPLTPNNDGWAAMRAWVARYSETYARYQAVFNAYQTAVKDDDLLVTVAATIQSKLATTTLPPRQLDPVVRLLLECVTHTLDVSGILGSVAAVSYPSSGVETSITDVLHRTFFGVQPDVNVHAPAAPPPPALQFSRALFELRQPDDEPLDSTTAAKGTLTALLASGRDVFVARGYHNTRVDDVVAAAGVSHGAFYRHFRNKDHLARILTARATRAVGTTLLEIPDTFAGNGLAGTRVLRRWLRRYNKAQVNEAAMLRVWVDAALHDPALRAESAPPLDWGRRRMARYLQPRGFGDVELDAVVMVALFGVFGARARPAAEVEAAAHIIERGLLGS